MRALFVPDGSRGATWSVPRLRFQRATLLTLICSMLIRRTYPPRCCYPGGVCGQNTRLCRVARTSHYVNTFRAVCCPSCHCPPIHSRFSIIELLLMLILHPLHCGRCLMVGFIATEASSTGKVNCHKRTMMYKEPFPLSYTTRKL